jgi:hypothetical protein
MPIPSYSTYAATPPGALGRGEVEIDPYEMANLSPRTTGLALTVWVSPRGNARHDIRIKVSLVPGRMDVENTAVVAVRPQPRLLHGTLGPDDLEQIVAWIRLNHDAIVALWDDRIDTAEFIALHRRLG